MINYLNIILIKEVLYPLTIPQYPYKPRVSPVVVEDTKATIQNNVKW
jgi:hypothetical protein